MENQNYGPIIANLADILEIDASNLNLISNPNEPHTSFLYRGREIARANIFDAEITSINLILPCSPGQPKSYAPFLPGAAGFEIESVFISYHISKHPEFNVLLNDLMQREISREKLKWGHGHIIPDKECTLRALTNAMVYLSTNFNSFSPVNFYGQMTYVFGDSEGDMCVQFDTMAGLKKLAPEVKYHAEQGHYCIRERHLNAFNPWLFESIHIQMIADGTPKSISYLYENLDGLPVPSDGLFLMGSAGSYDKEEVNISSRTPDHPFLKIEIPQPESRESWIRHIELARNIEEMFK